MMSKALAATMVVCALGAAGQATAQARSAILDAGSIGAMRAQVDQRYQAALALTLSKEVVAANDVRYLWASETKVACGIAIGFLKTRTVDEDSIGKCDAYYQRMIAPPPAPPPAPLAAAVEEAPCAVKLPIVFYFEWDVAEPPAEAASVISTSVQQMKACGWSALQLAGHADASGPNDYNAALSDLRARNIAGLLVNAGAPAASITVQAFGESKPAVQTPDGVREPLNRRVELTAN
jgi:OmpA-OmpF porin, OOP family